MPRIIPPTLNYSWALLKNDQSSVVSELYIFQRAFTHYFCCGWAMLLLQSRPLLPLNTSRFQWKEKASHCSATWPAPTAPSRKASGWRMARRSQKRVTQARTLSTGQLFSRVWEEEVFSSLACVHVRCISAPQAEKTKSRWRWSVHVCLQLQHDSFGQRHHRS